MKILKTLAVLFVLLVLTVGAVAEEYTPFDIGEVELEFPRGLSIQVNQTKKGHIDVVIDSAATNWSTVVTQMDHWGEISVYANTVAPSTAAGGLGGLFNTEYGEQTDWSYPAMKPQYDVSLGVIKDYIASNEFSLGGVKGIMNYSITTNTLIPREYSEQNGQCLYLFEAYCNDKGEITEKKYCTISITYTDSSARKVTLNKVPVNRIVASEKAVPADESTADDKVKVTVTGGNVAYELVNNHSDPNTMGGHMELKTLVLPPEEARSFIMDPEVGEIRRGSAEAQEVFTNSVPPTDYFNASEASFFWYDGEFDAENNMPTGNLVRAERINVSMAVGNPVAWPNYVSEQEMEKVSKGSLSFGVYNKENNVAANPAFAAITYEAANGTLTIKRDESKAMPDDDLTNYALIQKIIAPDEAVYYSYSDSSFIESVFMGTWALSRGYDDQIKWELNDADREAVPEDKVIVFEDDLFSMAEYSGDEGLVTYYDNNVTADDSGDIVFIQWYDKDGNVIGVPQWYAIQYKPMAIVITKSIESEVPADANEPTLFTMVDAGGYRLKVTSYPQTSENNNQIHYELELFNQSGEYVDLSALPKGEYKLFIPFPDGINPDEYVFNVNHYDAAGEIVVEDANEEGGAKIALERNKENTGVYMTVTSLSPFVLSWQKPECKHDNLTYVPSVSGSDKNTEGVITETCSDCDHKATWTIAVDKTCVTGKELVYKVTHSADWKGGDPAITYIDANAMEIFNTTPTKLGKYELSVRFTSGATLHLPFEVVAAPAMPATGDNSLPLAALLAIAALALTGSFMLRRKANG